MNIPLMSKTWISKPSIMGVAILYMLELFLIAGVFRWLFKQNDGSHTNVA